MRENIVWFSFIFCFCGDLEALHTYNGYQQLNDEDYKTSYDVSVSYRYVPNVR